MAFELKSGNNPQFLKMGSSTPLTSRGVYSPFAKDDKDDDKDNDNDNDTSTTESVDDVAVERPDPLDPDREDGGLVDDGGPPDSSPPEEKDLNQLTGDERKAEYDKRGWAYDDTIKADTEGKPADEALPPAEELPDKPPAEELPDKPTQPKVEEIRTTNEKEALKETLTDTAGVVKGKVGGDVANVTAKLAEKKIKNKLKKKLAMKVASKVLLKAIPGVNVLSTGYDLFKLGQHAWRNKEQLKNWANRNSGNLKNQIRELTG